VLPVVPLLLCRATAVRARSIAIAIALTGIVRCPDWRSVALAIIVPLSSSSDSP
jgi:hypothetical protein